ncbi:MAG: right-handed parallel beta-helix repeat-containing protein [Thermoguttaceae bacterium]|nr:right-handed parallel beta-helix repeat-containing protein [Thermoguttaceae bacterium]
MAKVRTVYSTQDDGAGTLRDALRSTALYTSEWINDGALVNGDIIDFDDSLEDEESGVITILLSSQIDLPARALTIDGGAHTGSGETLQTRVILDAQQLGRVIFGSTSGGLTLKNITFKDGYQSGTANAGFVQIRNSGSYGINAFDNCVFKQTYEGNAAYNGGGLFIGSSSINNITNCSFYNCGASYGGSLFCRDTSNSTFTNCAFVGCKASVNGGGIYALGTAQNTLTNCTFDSCSATTGGAVYSYGTSQNTLTNCTFDTCSAGNYGGAVYSANTSKNTLTDCTFDSCSAGTNGGAVYANNTSQNSIVNCVFIPPENNEKTTIHNNGTNVDGSLIINGSTVCDRVQFAANTTSVINGKITVDVLTISNGATITFSGVDSVLAVTTTATIGSATFTAAADSTGYLALYSGATAPTVGTGILVCTYGADLLTFSADVDGATWTATNLSTPILIEKQNGSTWTALTANATGGSYSTTFVKGDVVRAFDGEKFISITAQSPWVLNNWEQNSWTLLNWEMI